jgi:radical SAM superfamily enzyme YgiQ (UPF0313 family)
MKITLILAAADDDPLRHNEPFMPLSLPLLAAAAPDHEYTLVDMLGGERPDPKALPDVVGISARATSERVAFAIADGYRARGVPVILGGAQPSAAPHRAAEHADAVVVGEGEHLWPILLEDLAAGRLRRFYVCSAAEFDGRGGTVHALRGFPDLAGTPRAARHLFKGRRYAFDTVFASRGCGVDCSFCSVPSMFGHRTRLRPVADVVAEIAALEGMYYLIDDTVFGRPSTYDYYLELYEAVGAFERKHLWTGQANLDAAAHPRGREVIRSAARAGLVYASIGMESVDRGVLERSGAVAKMGVSSAADAVSVMKEHIAFIQDQGILVSGWFVVGYDEDTIDSWYRALEFCEETNVIPVISPLEALEGTRLWDLLEAQGRIDPGKAVNVVHPSITDEELLAAMRETTRRGFSLAKAVSRTRFHAGRFSRLAATLPKRERMRARIERTIFAYVLQRKMRKGIIGLVNRFR